MRNFGPCWYHHVSREGTSNSFYVGFGVSDQSFYGSQIVYVIGLVIVLKTNAIYQNLYNNDPLY